MAPRKRIALKPKPLSSQNGSTNSTSRSQTQGKKKNTINSGDLTVYLKLSILVLLLFALGGFLLYPDILNVLKVLRENNTSNVRISEEAQGLPVREPSVNKQRSSKEKEHIPANSPPDSLDLNQSIRDDVEKEDLMEDEELHKNTEHVKYSEAHNHAANNNTATRQSNKEPSGTQNKAVNENTATRQNKKEPSATENKIVKEKTATRQNTNVPSPSENKATKEKTVTRQNTNEPSATENKAAKEKTATRQNTNEPSATENKAAKEKTATRQNTNEPSATENKAAKEKTATRQNTNEPSATENKIVKEKTATRQNTNEPSATENKAAKEKTATRQNTNVPSPTENKATKENTATRQNTNVPSPTENKATKENTATRQNTNVPSPTENKATKEKTATRQNTNEPSATENKAAKENTATRQNTNEPSATENKATKEKTATRQNKNEPSATENKATKENTATRQNTNEPSATENKATKENTATRQKKNEHSDTQIKATNRHAATRARQSKNGNPPPEEEHNREKTAIAKEKSSSTEANKEKERTSQSQNENAGQKREPIILNAKNNQIVLDPSQIKIVDSSPDEKVKPKQVKGKQATGSTETQNTEKKKQKSNTEAKAQTANMDGENLDLLEEAKNFNASFQKTFTPKKIFADGRRIPPTQLLHQKTSNSSVRVFLFDDFLSQQECDGLIKAHDNHVKALNKPPILCFDSVTTLRKHIKDAKKNIDVTPRDFTKGTKCVNASFSLQLQNWMQSNWSYSTAFYPGESPFSKIIASRIKDAMGLDPVSGGKFQITSYPEGKAYKEHTDCTLGGKDQRDRVVSVMMYLSNVDEGGETTFPELGIWVKPRKGRALVWNNMSPDGVCEDHSKHVASVVKKGSKYILIRWYYYKTFYSLGRRPPTPHLPEREPEQPVVLCDEYGSGSCRWYDEWTYQHMLDYQKNTFQLL